MWENIELITEIIKESINKTDVLNKLGLKNNGGNFNTLTSFIKKYNINVSHFDSTKTNKSKIHSKRRDIEEVLIKNSFISSNNLKIRLYYEGLKERKCELCEQGEDWMGKKMSLILDHINGDRYDNRLDNLRIVCPNCNGTLETHCRGLNKKSLGGKKCENVNCENRIKKRNKYCIDCHLDNLSKKKEIKNKEATIRNKEFDRLSFDLSRRKVERPSLEILLIDIKELGYRGTGKKYSVSDNAIRKWIKNYNK